MTSRIEPRRGTGNSASGRGGLPILLAAVLLLGAGVARGEVELVSVNSNGNPGNGPSSGPVPSGDGTCVAFYSEATNFPTRLGPDAKHTPFRDVYVHSRITGLLTRVSVNSDGQEANGPSQADGMPPGIDTSCTCVAFSSDATNLVPGDSNQTTDVYVRNLLPPASTRRVSESSSGEQGNGPSVFGRVSGNCNLVAFQSSASNLVPDDTNGYSDIFLRDRAAQTTIRVSLGPDGEADGDSVTPTISADGRCVAFASSANNLWPGGSNGSRQIYVWCDGAITCRASTGYDGNPGNGTSFLPALNADGTIVAFKSDAGNLVPGDFNRFTDVFVHNCGSGETRLVSVSAAGRSANDGSHGPAIDGEGRFVAFASAATNLVAGKDVLGQQQMYVRDLAMGRTSIASVSPAGRPANGSVPDLPPGITLDGTFVTFADTATNLVPGVRNGFLDAYFGNSVTGCTDNEQCPGGQVCVDGQCLEPTPTPTVEGTDTPTPSVTPTVTPTPIPCFTNQDCPLGQVCVDGRCQPAPTPTPTIACMTTEDCPPGLECVDGVCRDLNTPTPTPTPLPPCTTDEDCPEGRVCRGNQCVLPRPCDDDDPEIDRILCLGGREACVDGFCECGGDCNLDGYVVGTETTGMVCVATGNCELSECPAGDINGDGEITGTEICDAVSNLGLGCPVPATALRFEQNRTEEVRTIEVGSATGFRGTPVNIPVAMSGGGDVATVQIDLLFPSAVLTLTNPDAACQLDPRLTATHQSFKFQPQRPSDPPGVSRLRVFIANLDLCENDQSFPVAPFDSGPLFSCNFLINPAAAPGVYPITIDDSPIGDGADGLARLEIGDPVGARFGHAFTPGSVTVQIQPCESDEMCPEGLVCRGGMCVPILPCTGPMEGPAECRDGRETCLNNQCECTGDCNLDGEVTVLEVQTVITIFGGELTLEACPSADQSGDGMVSVLDIQVAITNYGLGCPGLQPVP